MGELLDTWLDLRERRPGTPDSTRRSYTLAVRHLKGWLLPIRLDRVRRDILERYIVDRIGEGASQRTVQLEVRVCRAAWNWGRDCGHVTQEWPRVTVHVDADAFVENHHTPPPVDIDAVLRWLRSYQGGRWWLPIALLAETGARASEVAGLTPEQVLVGGVCIRGKRKPNGKTRVRIVPIVDREVLAAAQVGPVGWVAGSLRDVLRKACAAAEVQPFTPHGLRRAKAMAMVRAGVPLPAAAKFLGNTEMVMLQFYTHANVADLEDAARRTRRPRGKVEQFRAKAEEGT